MHLHSHSSRVRHWCCSVFQHQWDYLNSAGSWIWHKTDTDIQEWFQWSSPWWSRLEHVDEIGVYSTLVKWDSSVAEEWGRIKKIKLKKIKFLLIMWGNKHSLEQGKFKFNIKKIYLTFRSVAKEWNKISVEFVSSLSLKMLKPKRRPKQHSQANIDVILLQSYSPFSFVWCSLVYLTTVIDALCMTHASPSLWSWSEYCGFTLWCIKGRTDMKK